MTNGGRHTEARVHRHSGELHADAAAEAETLIGLDQDVEGDQLGHSPPVGHRGKQLHSIARPGGGARPANRLVLAVRLGGVVVRVTL